MFRLHKKSATGFQNKTKFKLPEGKGKKRRQLLKIYRKFKYIILPFLFIILVLGVVLIERVFSPFTVTDIVAKNFVITEVDKSILIGKKLYLINDKALSDLLVQNHIEVKSFEIIKQYPYTLQVIAKKREGLFKIKNNNLYFIIDDDGVIFKSEKNSTLPNLPIRVDKIEIGTSLDKKELDLYTSIVKDLLNIKLGVEFVYLEGDYIYAITDKNYKIRFGKDSYKQEIDLYVKAITQIDSDQKIKEVRFVENRVVVEYTTAR